MIDDRVPPWSPPGKVVLYLDYIDEEPRPPRDPVERTWDIPAFVDDIGLRPEQRTPVVVEIGIPIAGPPIPVAVIRMMDDGKIARPRLKKHKAHITYIEAVLSLGHDMHLHRVVFHVAAARDNNGFRVQFGSEDERISIQGGLLARTQSLVLIPISALDPEPAGYCVVPGCVTILDGNLQILSPARDFEIIDSARQTGFISVFAPPRG
jgi:hypothetical protein